MSRINYIVTFSENTEKGLYPLTVKTKAFGVHQAIDVATEAVKDDRVDARNLVLVSVVPEPYPFAVDGVNSDGVLRPCPFCGNHNVSLIEAITDAETMYLVNCGCCNATQLPDSKERAINDWNQRTPEATA